MTTLGCLSRLLRIWFSLVLWLIF